MLGVAATAATVGALAWVLSSPTTEPFKTELVIVLMVGGLATLLAVFGFS
jgi:hypothetical protein